MRPDPLVFVSGTAPTDPATGAFNFGTLIVSGTGTSHAPILGIAGPMGFRKAFIEAQDSGNSDA